MSADRPAPRLPRARHRRTADLRPGPGPSSAPAVRWPRMPAGPPRRGASRDGRCARADRTSSSSCGRLAAETPNTAPRPARRSAPTGERIPAGSATVTGSSSRSSTVRVWWEMPRWRARGSPEDIRATSRVGAPNASAAWAESSAAMPPCPSGEREPTIPGPGPHSAASQPSVRSPWCSAPAVVTASPSPPKAAPAVRWPASSPRSRSSRTIARVPARQRAAAGLHVSQPPPGGRPGEGPRHAQRAGRAARAPPPGAPAAAPLARPPPAARRAAGSCS